MTSKQDMFDHQALVFEPASVLLSQVEKRDRVKTDTEILVK